MYGARDEHDHVLSITTHPLRARPLAGDDDEDCDGVYQTAMGASNSGLQGGTTTPMMSRRTRASRHVGTAASWWESRDR